MRRRGWGGLRGSGLVVVRGAAGEDGPAELAVFHQGVEGAGVQAFVVGFVAAHFAFASAVGVVEGAGDAGGFVEVFRAGHGFDGVVDAGCFQALDAQGAPAGRYHHVDQGGFEGRGRGEFFG